MDLVAHLVRQMAFSHATFGPGERTHGVVDHIRKELVEVLAANGEADEWVDVVILALDGLTRRLAYCNGYRRDPTEVARIACRMIEGKQSRNEARTWPNWRTADANKAIEHDRTTDTARVSSTPTRVNHPGLKAGASESIYAATGLISDPTPIPGDKPKAL